MRRCWLRPFRWRRFRIAGASKQRPSLTCTPHFEAVENRCLLSGNVTSLSRVIDHASIRQKQLAAEIRRESSRPTLRAASNEAPDTILHDFGSTINNVPDGWQPWGSLTPVMTRSGLVIFGRTLYGGSSESNTAPTQSGGVIFTVNPDGSKYKIVHSFAGGVNDGWQPHHDQLRQIGNVLYGATLLGGSSTDVGLGVVFSIHTDGRKFKLLHAFTGESGGTPDGAMPHSNPMPNQSGKLLYGLTSEGGTSGISKGGDGTVYQIKPDGSDYKIIHSFKPSEGTDPHGFVIVAHHNLYGMTRQGGGSTNFGTVFDFNANTNKYKVLHTFLNGPNDGATPDHGGLLRIGHKLYGLTTSGGPNGQNKSNTAGDGVLFRIDTSKKNSFKILHPFGDGSTDGVGPHGSLFLYAGKLYGMTSNGGTFGAKDGGYGTIFRIDPNGKRYQVIYNFGGEPGDGNDGLDNVFIANGLIFGMTKYGGSIMGSSNFQNGVVFSLPVPK
jgi:uncharacterized repeat protein (TIGR03803 family)